MDLYILKTWLEAKFNRNEEGANLVEYALLVALIAILVIGAAVFLKDKIGGTLSRAGNSLDR